MHQVARAALAQFSHVKASEHIWTLVRSSAHLQTIRSGLERNPGILLYSIVDPKTRAELETLCQDLNVPNLSILDPLVDLFTTVLGYKQNSRPGGQHKLDRAYFERMAAVEFAVNHDDGLNMESLQNAQILLVGVSRTSKRQPLCIWLIGATGLQITRLCRAYHFRWKLSKNFRNYLLSD